MNNCCLLSGCLEARGAGDAAPVWGYCGYRAGRLARLLGPLTRPGYWGPGMGA